MIEETIDIEAALRALDEDLEHRQDIARRLEPVLRDIMRHYGVPGGSWHTFGIVFRMDSTESGQSGIEVAGMALRAMHNPPPMPGGPLSTTPGDQNGEE